MTMMEVPVMQTFAKAFILRGISDTSRAKLAVTMSEKSALEVERAAIEKELAIVDAGLTRATEDANLLKAEFVKQQDNAGLETALVPKFEASSETAELWRVA